MRLTYLEFIKWRKEYRRSDHSQRAGQHFLNTRQPDVADPELFYCEDQGRCEEIICERYVNMHIF